MGASRGLLTTHVLDTSRGVPAAGLTIDLFRIEGDSRRHIRTSVTNDDGRTSSPILPATEFRTGTYLLVFHAGGYFGDIEDWSGSPCFYDTVPVRFSISEEEHYHVPLLISPYGYSTYRGS